MPATLERSEMQRLARMGASARLHQLEQERAALLRAFPGLRSTPGEAAPAPREGSGQAQPKARRRRRFTAAQRKAIAARMRKYWAEKRKKSAK